MWPCTPPVRAVNQSTRAAGARRLEQVARPLDVDGAIRGVRLSRFAIGRGDVIHDLDAISGVPHGRRIAKVAFHRLYAERRQR